MRLSIRLFSVLVLLAVLSIAALVFGAYRIGIPTSAAGLAAHHACSGVFVAGRRLNDVIDNDIVPTTFIMRAAHIALDTKLRQASASLPGTG